MKILELRGYVLFITLGLVVFFLGAFLVILVRTKNPHETTMPNLVGKNYTNVHNELLRLRLKVNLEEIRIPEKNEGEIISQSVSPGKSIEAGSHVYLTVNQGYDRVEIPNLVGQSLTRAKETLEKVLSNEIYVPISIGGITYIEATDDEANDSVIDQIPEAGKITNSGEKIYLLVTEPKTKKEKTDQSFLNQPIPFVIQSLNRQKFPWKIQSFADTKLRSESGLVQSVQKESSLASIIVNRAPKGNSLIGGYEFVEWEVDDDGVYNVFLEDYETEAKTMDLIISQPWKEGQMMNFAFYRKGDILAKVQTTDKEIDKKFKFKVSIPN
ncbi:MAG: PASTA domain-containing protein [Leptospira sp.]|nr:PASTA domain-containing protein [Leptospira sp.]